MFKAFRPLGYYENIKSLALIANATDFSRASIRESDEQRDTRIEVGYYDMLGDISGVYDPAVMAKYESNIELIAEQLRKKYGYKNIIIKSFSAIMLKPHGVIEEHVDDAADVDTAYAYTHRVHIPTKTSSGCTFKFDGIEVQLPYGQMIEIDNLIPHSVTNDSDEERVHVLIDFYGEGYFNKALPPVPEYFYKEK